MTQNILPIPDGQDVRYDGHYVSQKRNPALESVAQDFDVIISGSSRH